MSLPYEFTGEPKGFSTPPEVRRIGLIQCHSCGSLNPEERVLCSRCDAYLPEHVYQSKMNQQNPN